MTEVLSQKKKLFIKKMNTALSPRLNENLCYNLAGYIHYNEFLLYLGTILSRIFYDHYYWGEEHHLLYRLYRGSYRDRPVIE